MQICFFKTYTVYDVSDVLHLSSGYNLAYKILIKTAAKPECIG